VPRIARAVTPGLVSTAAALSGMVALVVAVAGSPAPWWAAVAVGAVEALVASWLVGRNAQAAEQAEVTAKAAGRPESKPVRSAA